MNIYLWYFTEALYWYDKHISHVSLRNHLGFKSVA